MKIRKGFVSNSSTTSFLCYGWTKYELHYAQSEIDKLATRLEELTQEDVVNWDVNGTHYLGVAKWSGDLHPEEGDDMEINFRDELAVMLAVEQVQREFNLPEPDWYTDQYRDG